MIVTIHEAKTQLSKLIAAVEAGEEVIIARRDKPVVRLVKEEEKKGKRILGWGNPEGREIDLSFFEDEKVTQRVMQDFEDSVARDKATDSGHLK